MTKFQEGFNDGASGHEPRAGASDDYIEGFREGDEVRTEGMPAPVDVEREFVAGFEQWPDQQAIDCLAEERW